MQQPRCRRQCSDSWASHSSQWAANSSPSRAMARLFQQATGRPFRVSGADVLNGRPLLTTEVLT